MHKDSQCAHNVKAGTVLTALTIRDERVSHERNVRRSLLFTVSKNTSITSRDTVLIGRQTYINR